MADLKRSLDKAKVGILSMNNTAFISSVLFSLTQQWTDGDHKVQTGATDGINLYINEKFWEGLDADERIGLLLHEAYHVAYEHMLRRGGRDPKRWNVAADYVINGQLSILGVKLPEGGIPHKREYDNLSTEEVYDLLTDDDVPEDADDDIMEPSDDGGEDGDNEAQGQPTRAQVEAAVQGAMIRGALEAEISNQAGSVPNSIARRVDEINNPRLDWRTILANHMSAYAKDDYSMQRPNRRFFPNFHLPSMFSEGMGEITIAIDTSGSVDENDFKAMVAEAVGIKEMLNPEKINFYCFDTDLHDIGSFGREEDIYGLEMVGGGGTCIEPVQEMLAETNPEVAVIFTDGYFSSCDIKPESDVIWLIYNNENFSYDFGQVIHYDKTK